MCIKFSHSTNCHLGAVAFGNSKTNLNGTCTVLHFCRKMPIFFSENRLPGPIQLDLITANSHVFVQFIKKPNSWATVRWNAKIFHGGDATINSVHAWPRNCQR